MVQAFGWEIQVTNGTRTSKTAAPSKEPKARGGVGHSTAAKDAEEEVRAKQDYLKWKLTRKKRKAEWEESDGEADEQPPQILSPVERALRNMKPKESKKSKKASRTQCESVTECAQPDKTASESSKASGRPRQDDPADAVPVRNPGKEAARKVQKAAKKRSAEERAAGTDEKDASSPAKTGKARKSRELPTEGDEVHIKKKNKDKKKGLSKDGKAPVAKHEVQKK